MTYNGRKTVDSGLKSGDCLPHHTCVTSAEKLMKNVKEIATRSRMQS